MKQMFALALAALMSGSLVWANINTQEDDSGFTDLTKAATADLMVLAEQNDATAQYYLSQRYAAGEGVEQDPVQAYKWALLAERNGVNALGGTAQLKEQLTEEQVLTALALADMFGAAVCPVFRFVSETDGFSVLVPDSPKRTIVQDNARVYAVHYQALDDDGLTQYNASFHYFKDRRIQGGKAEAQFLKEYLAGRTLFAWKNQLWKKTFKLNGYSAAQFRHKTHSGPTEMVHEGVTFLVNGNAVTLTCVYPEGTEPSLGFQDYMESFELIDP